ncbi:hypothetical protein BD311DRAFT_659291 [Dichomitus squalens]|uniref:Arrestin-like N-terminal domain-containing protein n=1 Tax=Dichomitus squalens TaxID=114155 RepID=A0A4Q9MSX9_9APHY|nr:hypothetical protein BD311DRAFT_659291 [Dichomitus squalens]
MDPELPHYARTHSTTLRRDRRTSAGANSFSSSPRTPVEHLYHLTSSKGRPWLTLKVISKAPASTFLPSFYEGEPIKGSVTLDLTKEESIKAISVQAIGEMTSSVTEILNFVQVSETLWKSSAPPEPSSPSGSQNASKLVGEHSWPFSLTLPPVCQVRLPTATAETFPLPGSFSERLARVHIQYQVIATVHRSRFRVDNSVSTIIGYIPIIRPEAPSIARQIAYLENTPLPGPEADPEGWHCLEPLQVRGSVFSTREVDAKCTFALAKPLTYTRGSVIPCLMTVETTDPQALDLLSSPRSLVVRLLRQIATGEASLSVTPLGGKRLPGLDYERAVQGLATAVWRPDSSRNPHKRVLHGEIHLPSMLKPTCHLGKFELTVSVSAPVDSPAFTQGFPHAIVAQYSVAVYAPKAVAFQPDGDAEAVLQQLPVVIGTAYAAGPRPRIYSPPAYDDASSRASEFLIFR